MLPEDLRQRLFPYEYFHLEVFRRGIADNMPVRGRALDLGCGDNSCLSSYRTPGREVWGTDFQVHPALQDPEWFRLLGPHGAIPFPNDHFDLVVCDWVLEHVVSPTTFLAEVRRVLRPGGAFVAQSISGRHYVTWCRRLLDFFPHEVVQGLMTRLYGRPGHDTFPTRYRMNTPRQLAAASTGAGLRLESLRYGCSQAHFRFLPWLEKLAIRVDRWLEHLGPGCGRLYFVVLLRRPPVARASLLAA